ncbi:MAG TPA: tetratricopeptide repeat protein [Pseudonocardiaceae bacterium]
MSGDAFGALLHAGRRSAGLSQEELAERSGLSVRTIRELEHGRTRRPYRDSVHRLADALELRDTARAEFIAAGRRPSRPATAPPVGGNTQQPGGGRVVPRQLPGRPPTFVGRQDQLAVLSRVLHQPGGTAIITAIRGTAGVGKTALAVQWAYQVAAEFPDGQLFLNLRGFDPSGTPVPSDDALRVFLDGLGIPADQLPTTMDAQRGLYRSLLVGKRMLVVLDNAHDAAQVRPLLPGSPTCRVVVTSRNQLVGLVAVDAAQPLTLDVLTDVEAHQLLRQRLGVERLAVDHDAVTQIITSCARLPLALCIVAAYAATRPDLPLAHVAADLAAHPTLATFTDDADPAADIRAVFSWSYRQLSPDTARVFRLIGLHPGPDLEPYAVAALTSGTVDEAEHALDLLARASLIQPVGPTRYGMHDLLRGYARELATAGNDEQDRQAALTRLFDYYCDAATTAMDAAFPAEHHRRPTVPPAVTPVPVFTDELAALAWLDVARPSLVAVTGHAAEEGWAGHAILLSAILFRYLDSGAHFTDALIVHGHARRAAREVGDRRGEANALVCLGLVNGHQGRQPQATAQFERALALHNETGDLDGQARALNYLGLAHAREGRYQQAQYDFQRTVTLFRTVGERNGEAFALSNLGAISLRQGDLRQAIDYQSQALAAFREIGDRDAEATVLSRLGLVNLQLGDYQQARDVIRQALARFHEVGDREGEADALARLGLVDTRRGYYEDAAENLRQALIQFQNIGDQFGQAEALNALGEVHIATSHHADARVRHSAALRIAEQVGEKNEQARAHNGLASAYQADGDTRKARRHWREALDLYTDLGAPEAAEVRARLQLCR